MTILALTLLEALCLTSTAAAALPAKVIARQKVSCEFAVTGLSASVKRCRFPISSTSMTDRSNFPKMVELRGKWFTSPYPTDTIVELCSLALPELEIEIEAVAVADEAAERV